MTTQPEALRLAEELDDGYPLTGDAISAAAELRRQHARITKLEAQLSAIGAGGVSPLMNAAQEATHLRELAAYRLTVENLEREIAAQQPAPSPAPPGWKLVPVEPTEEMLKAADDGDDAYTRRSFGPDVQRVMQGPYDHYCAMLDAAPTAQADVTGALAEAEYFIDNPSAWESFDQRVSDAIERVTKALRASHGQAPAHTPADSVLEDAEIDRIVPALEPVSEDFPAEWAVWKDRERIREELRAARKQGEKQ